MVVSKWKPYQKYKDSGVEWISDIPEHWNVKKLKYLVNLVNCNNNLNTPELKIALENIESHTGKLLNLDLESFEREAKFFEKGDVLFNKLRPYLAKAYNAKNNGVCVGELLIFRPEKLITSDYLFYRVLSKDFIDQVNSSTYGTKMPRASWDFIGNLFIPDPPVKEQNVICNCIDEEIGKIESLISKKGKLIQFLKEKRSSLISHTVTKGLNPSVHLKDSDTEWIGKIPEHWVIKKLKYILKNSLTNGLFKKKEDFGFGFKLINVIDIYNDNFIIDYDQLDRVNATQEETKIYSALPGDIFFVRSSLKLEGIGASACLNEILEPTVFECHLIRARPSTMQIIPKFLIYYLNSTLIRQRLVALAETTTMTTIAQPKLLSIEVITPPLEEQNAIVENLDREITKIDSLISKIQEAIEKFKEYRTSLISAAVTGKIMID